jgi:hypothetical protein
MASQGQGRRGRISDGSKGLRTTFPEQEEGRQEGVSQRAWVLEGAVVRGLLLTEKIQVKTCALKVPLHIPSGVWIRGFNDLCKE